MVKILQLNVKYLIAWGIYTKCISSNMNMEKSVVFTSHWKLKKTIVYGFNNVLLNYSITKRLSERLFELILVFQSCFDVCYIRVFANFLDDPYYEQLPLFMIKIHKDMNYIHCKIMSGGTRIISAIHSNTHAILTWLVTKCFFDC